MVADTPVLSVIVPTYNAASTLEQCVRSIQANKNVSLEIILVDDGSKDQSPQICDRLAAEDPRIRVIRKENGGVGSARREGTAAARGTYLTFVDSDDTVKPDMYEKMLALALMHQADGVVCNMEAVYQSGTLPACHTFGNQVITGNQNIRERIVVPLITPNHPDAAKMQGTCNKLYRTDLIRQHQIQFPDLPRAEDWMFNIEFYRQAECIAFSDLCLYRYDRTTPGSLSKTLPPNGIESSLWIQNRLSELFPERYPAENLLPGTLNIQKQELLQHADCLGIKGYAAYASQIFHHPQLRLAYEALETVPKQYRFPKKCVLSNRETCYHLWCFWIAKAKFVKHMLRPAYHLVKRLLGTAK